MRTELFQLVNQTPLISLFTSSCSHWFLGLLVPARLQMRFRLASCTDRPPLTLSPATHLSPMTWGISGKAEVSHAVGFSQHHPHAPWMCREPTSHSDELLTMELVGRLFSLPPLGGGSWDTQFIQPPGGPSQEIKQSVCSYWRPTQDIVLCWCFWLPYFAPFYYCSSFFGFALVDKVIAQKHLPLALLSGATQAKTISNLIFFSWLHTNTYEAGVIQTKGHDSITEHSI